MPAVSSRKKDPQFKSLPAFDFFGATLVIMLITLAVFLLTAKFGLVTYQARQRQQYHQEQLQEIAQLITNYTDKTQGMLPTGVDIFPRQIGLATDGCELSAHSCEASISACTNLTHLLLDSMQTVPAVIQTGNAARTGFVVWQSQPNQLSLRACSSDAASLDITIPNLRLYSPEEAARVVTTSSITTK